MEMIDYDGPVIFDCLVDEKHENCFPMIPSGKPHNEMLLQTFIGMMESLGLVDVVRTGIVAMSRGGEAL
jgi:acetolactate synthase small subunit